MNTLILDLETTIKTVNKRKASPFSDNWVVAAGYRHNEEEVFCSYFQDRQGWRYHYVPIRETTEVLVGFNIKFDLLYMWGKSEVRNYLSRGGRIWDCQYVHYLLCGMSQSSHMVSMDAITEEYGGSLKLDAVKEFWEQGIDTPAIPEDLLMDYLAGDILNTHTIYQGQVKRVQEAHPHMMQMIWNRMDGLLCTTEMEFNGMQIDMAQGEEDRIDLLNRLSELREKLNESLPEDLPPEFEFNWNSNHHKSYFLFGGCASYKKWIQHKDVFGELMYASKIEKEVVTDEFDEPVRFKSGKRQGEIKTRNVKVPDYTKPKGALQDQYYSFRALTKAKDEWESKQEDAAGSPIYSTSSDVIEILGNRDIPELKLMAEAQKVNKDLGTYYWSEDGKGNKKGMLTLVGADGRIHHKLNHTSTVTGRLSSSDPNMQNIPRGDKSLVKRMFVSRFGKSGRIIEIDYSQLEVIVQGVLSRDKQLCRDINEGVDFHVKRLSAATGKDYEHLKRLHLSGDESVAAERTRIKGFTFQRAYGAGPQAISESTGIPLKEVKDLIRAEEALYPGVTRFDGRVEESIINTAKPSGRYITLNGVSHLIKEGHWWCPTGTKYNFSEEIAPQFLQERGIFTSFSPTQRKNYPVQGLGGEIVQTMIGKMFRFFAKQNNYNERAFLINTVHDCILIDCHEDMVGLVVTHAVQMMEKVPNVFNYYFDMKINVPFPVEAEVGMNWYEMEHWDAGK